MSNTISNTNGTLAGALLNLGTSTQSGASNTADANANSGVNVDSLQLSGSSISQLEQQAAEIAAQNQNSVIATSEEAQVVNLQAISMLGQNFDQATASASDLSGGTVLSLTQ
jgi:hypothetical protein